MKTIADILTGRAVIALGQEASALEASRTMAAHHVGAILVVDGEGRPLGVFTERDLMTRVVSVERDPGATKIAEVMTRELFTARPEEKLADVAAELQTRHIRHLPILDAGGRLIAVLSQRDLLREQVRQRERELQDLQAYIQGPPEVP